MAVLLDSKTRLIVQGLTGREGTFHANQEVVDGAEVNGSAPDHAPALVLDDAAHRLEIEIDPGQRFHRIGSARRRRDRAG